MADTAVSEGPKVRVSTLLGMAVMDGVEAGSRYYSIMLHEVPRDVIEQIRSRLLAAGWVADDNPSNNGMRGAKDPATGCYVSMWPEHV